MVIARTRRRARTHVLVGAANISAWHGTLGESSFGNAAGLRRYVPDDPVQHVIGAAAERDIDIVEDDRVADRAFRRIREREARLHVLAADDVLVRDDPAVLERVG